MCRGFDTNYRSHFQGSNNSGHSAWTAGPWIQIGSSETSVTHYQSKLRNVRKGDVLYNMAEARNRVRLIDLLDSMQTLKTI
jgi:hypothetical protein